MTEMTLPEALAKLRVGDVMCRLSKSEDKFFINPVNGNILYWCQTMADMGYDALYQDEKIVNEELNDFYEDWVIEERE